MRQNEKYEGIRNCIISPLSSQTQARTYLIRYGHRLYVLKDISCKNKIYRLLFGRWLLKREFKIYQRLSGIPGIPRAISLIDKDAFIMEYIDGSHINSAPPSHIKWNIFFSALEILVEQIHQRGIAHADLKKRNNIIVKGNLPYIVDFGASIIWNKKARGIKRWLFEECCKMDMTAIAKLKRKFAPHLLTPIDIDNISKYNLLEFAGRIINELRRIIKGKKIRFIKRYKRRKNKKI